MKIISRKYPSTLRILFIGIVIFLSLLHLFIPLLNHYYFRTFAFDYGVYNFAFYDFAHFRISQCPVYLVFLKEANFLQDHFSLTLLLISPIYWLIYFFTGTYSLLIIQWLAIQYGAWATYKLVDLKVGNHKMAALALIYYFIIYGRFSSYQNDCNLAIIGAAILPVFVYYFEARKYWATILTFLFLVINREDFSLCLVFVCAFLGVINRKNKSQMILASKLALVALFSFIFIYQIIIPLLHDSKNEFRLFDYNVLGPNPKEALIFILSHPIKSISYLFINHTDNLSNNNIKLGFYLVYGFSGGLILLWRPSYFIFMIPFFAKKMFNDSSDRWGYEMYYSVEVASVLPILVFMILADLKSQKMQLYLAYLVCILGVIVTVYCLSIAKYPNPYQKFNFLKSEFYLPDCEVNKMHMALNKIPETAAVSASSRLLPNLALRNSVYHFPIIKEAEFVCLLKHGDTYPSSSEKFEEVWKNLLNSGKWTTEYELDNFIILHRKSVSSLN